LQDQRYGAVLLALPSGSSVLPDGFEPFMSHYYLDLKPKEEE
jgi:hypothetical protein